MPYEWTRPNGPDAPMAELHLWPYRSLPRRGMAWFLGITATLIALPLIVVMGSPILWGLLPFFVLTVAGVWMALNRSFKDGEVVEELRLWDDHITLDRHNPRGPRQSWEANPHWVQVSLHPNGGPVEYYLTLKGNGREVELGAFLTGDERVSLRRELSEKLKATCAPVLR